MLEKLPFFSIIIPTYGRFAQLGNCLRSIAALDYPRERFEVLVVDDGNETQPNTVVDPFKNEIDITLLTQPHSGPAIARNLGASKAKGDYLAFTDDDCSPVSNWLQTLAVRFSDKPECVIGGRTLNGFSNSLCSIASQILIDYLCSYYNSDPNQARFVASNNLAMPTNVFRKLGGFDKRFPRAAAEDRELCDRLLQHGYKILYAPEVQIYHSHALTFFSFWKQHFNYGAGAYRFYSVRAERDGLPIGVEPFTFYLNLLKFPFSKAPRSQVFSLIALLFISQVANASGYFWQKLFGDKAAEYVFIHKLGGDEPAE